MIARFARGSPGNGTERWIRARAREIKREREKKRVRESKSHAISFHCDKAGYISVRKALKGALPRPALPRISLLSCLATYLWATNNGVALVFSQTRIVALMQLSSRKWKSSRFPPIVLSQHAQRSGKNAFSLSKKFCILVVEREFFREKFFSIAG